MFFISTCKVLLYPIEGIFRKYIKTLRELCPQIFRLYSTWQNVPDEQCSSGLLKPFHSENIINHRQNSRKKFASLVSVKTFVLVNILCIKTQSVHIIISRIK